MTTAERNRAIKRVVSDAFPGRRVTVRGSRGTAYGWVRVKIDWTPLDCEKAREMTALIWQLLTAAGLDKQIGTYGYDDPGSDYGCGREIHIDFNSARFRRTMVMSDGTVVGQTDWDDDWQRVASVGEETTP